ncbi:hypothetical protein TgHK011_006625 [Trichoderma gracile]|nr:hypothetical protein TgHK011_006625 [Trichoderma gracile]
MINEQRLSQLPVDGDVSQQVLNHRQAEVDIEDELAADDMPEGDDFDAAAVPNLIAAQADLDELRAELEGQVQPPGEQIPLQSSQAASQASHQQPQQPQQQQPFLRMPDIRSTL